MAKDILKFHAVIWPALLMSAGYELPEGEFIHGYLLMGGEKMSKTRGNVLDPFAVIEQLRRRPAALLPHARGHLRARTASSSLEGFESRYNNELANELGNLVSRTVSHDRQVPRRAASRRAGRLAPGDVARRGRGDGGAGRRAACDAVEVTAALESIWEFVRRLNRSSRKRRPGSSPRTRRRRRASTRCSHGLAAGLRLVALCLYPVMPGTAVEILRRLGQPHGDGDLLLDGAVLGGSRRPPSRRRRRCSRASRPRPAGGSRWTPLPSAGLTSTRHCHLD